MTVDRFVIDANIALYAFSPNHALEPALLPNAEAAQRFLLRAIQEGAALFVPWLFFSEVINTVTKNVASGGLGRFANTLSHFVLSLHCKPPVVSTRVPGKKLDKRPVKLFEICPNCTRG